MLDPRKPAFFAITAIVLAATTYSVLYGTYLDTSDPLLSQLPHPLSNSTYWARKSNILNQWIKISWGLTSIVFWSLFLSSPRPAMRVQRVIKWLLETATWMIFTTWFFGPSVLERVVLISGGECLLSTPHGDAITVPTQYCIQKQSVSHSTHPHLFTSFLPSPDWQGAPRLKRGHDISGHIFLLTMAVLFLADQLRASLRFQSTWSAPHQLAVLSSVVLIAVWLFGIYTTSLYFHTPSEKLSGYCTSLFFLIYSLTQIKFEYLGWPPSA